MRIRWCILLLLLLGFVGVADAGRLPNYGLIETWAVKLARVARGVYAVRSWQELGQWREPVFLVVGIIIALAAGEHLYRKSIWWSVGFVIAIGTFLFFYVPGAIERFNASSGCSVKTSLNSQPNFVSNPFSAKPLLPWWSSTNSVVPSAGGEYLKIAKPPQKSFSSLLERAERGDADAQFQLGCDYYNGRGVSPDYARAYAWLNLASVKGNRDANALQSAILKLMTPEQYAEGQRLSHEYAGKFMK